MHSTDFSVSKRVLHQKVVNLRIKTRVQQQNNTSYGEDLKEIPEEKEPKFDIKYNTPKAIEEVNLKSQI